MAIFAMADRLNMSVSEVETWPMSELMEWFAYAKIERERVDDDTTT